MGKYLFLRWVEHIAFAALGKGTDSRQAVFKGHDRTADRHEMRALGQYQGDCWKHFALAACQRTAADPGFASSRQSLFIHIAQNNYYPILITFRYVKLRVTIFQLKIGKKKSP